MTYNMYAKLNVHYCTIISLFDYKSHYSIYNYFIILPNLYLSLQFKLFIIFIYYTQSSLNI